MRPPGSHEIDEQFSARAADLYARRAALTAQPSPLSRFLDAAEFGTPADVLAELELARCRALLGEPTLLDADLDFRA